MSGSVRKPQYYLIACGTKDYHPQSGYSALPSVKDDLERVVKVLEKFGYEHALADVLSLNPSLNDLTEKFADWLLSEKLTVNDRVIFYYSGHGCNVDGDGHYLLLSDAKQPAWMQNSLETSELVKPLIYKEVQLTQILYIIDTCHAGQGIADINGFASNVIARHRAVYEENPKSVHLIAASRLKQPAKTGAFSIAFKSALEQLLNEYEEFGKEKYIQPSTLVAKINNVISQSKASRQEVGHAKSPSAEEAYFFPLYSKTIRVWKDQCETSINKLNSILCKGGKDDLLYVNSFTLARQFFGKPLCKFISNRQEYIQYLKRLGSLQIKGGICPLISYSEWCRKCFSDSRTGNQNTELASRIEDWQRDTILYRPEADLNQIQDLISEYRLKLQDILQEKTLRLQIEIKDQIDPAYNTGASSGTMLLNMYLCKDKDTSWGQLERDLPVKLIQEDTDIWKSVQLSDCLVREDFLINLIRKVRGSLRSNFDSPLVNLELEFLLPFDYYNEPLDAIKFEPPRRRSQRRRRKDSLGYEYPVFISPSERYFFQAGGYDGYMDEIAERIYKKKLDIWGTDDREPTRGPKRCPESVNEGNAKAFDPYDIFIRGKMPSPNEMEMIDDSLPIAVWSRDDGIDISEALKLADWEDWPKKLHEFRQEMERKDRPVNITLFWDDLYSKPSERVRLLDPSVVE